MLLQQKIVEKTSPGFHKPTIPYYDTNFRPEVVAIDTETTGLDWSKDDCLFGISAAWYDSSGELFTTYWDFPVNTNTRVPDYQGCKGLNLLNSYYSDPAIKIVMANSKFDRHMLSKIHLNRFGKIHDVLIAAWCCNTLEPSYKLNDLAEKYLKVDQDDAKLLKERVHAARKKAKKLGFNAGPNISSVYQDYWLLKYFDHNDKTCQIYAEKDAGVRTLNLWYFYEEAMRELKVRKAFDVETELTDVLYRMENRGVRFSEDNCVAELETLRGKIEEAKEPIIARFGDININSGKQLITCLYDVKDKHSASLDLPILERTETRLPSTSAPTFEKLLPIDNSGIIESLLKYQGYSTGEKSCKNYIKAQVKDEKVTLDDFLHLHQKKAIHPNFNQIFSQADRENKTRTGRLSSSNPNLQNVADPEKSQGNYVTDSRSFFGPRDGFVWYCFDYSQLELRIFAERLGAATAMYRAFLAGEDPHNATREGIAYLASMDEEIGRKLAKNFNFGVINSAGIKVFHKKYGMPIQEAKEGLEGFYELYPETKLRQKEAEKFAIKNGYIETLFKRKIHVDRSRYSAKEANIAGKSYLTGRYKYAYRASAYDIQGSAADIIKRGMIQCQDFISDFKPSKLDAHLLLSVHDELIFEVKQKNAYKWFLRGIKMIMESVAKEVMQLPLKVTIKKTSETWSSKHLRKVEV